MYANEWRCSAGWLSDDVRVQSPCEGQRAIMYFCESCTWRVFLTVLHWNSQKIASIHQLYIKSPWNFNFSSTWRQQWLSWHLLFWRKWSRCACFFFAWPSPANGCLRLWPPCPILASLKQQVRRLTTFTDVSQRAGVTVTSSSVLAWPWRQAAFWHGRDVKQRSGMAVTSSIVLTWPWRQASFWRVVTMTPAHVIVVAAHRQQLLAALSCITIAQPQQLHGLFMTSQNMSVWPVSLPVVTGL